MFFGTDGEIVDGNIRITEQGQAPLEFFILRNLDAV